MTPVELALALRLASRLMPVLIDLLEGNRGQVSQQEMFDALKRADAAEKRFRDAIKKGKNNGADTGGTDEVAER